MTDPSARALLRYQRLALGLTQGQLAKALGLHGTYRTVNKWERGVRAIPGPVQVLMRIWDDPELPTKFMPKGGK